MIRPEDFRINVSYDHANNRLTERLEVWDAETGEWVKVRRVGYACETKPQDQNG